MNAHTPTPQDAPLNVRYVILVVYIGGEAAAQTLVDTAQTDLAQINDLIASVANATGGAVTVQQVRVRQNLSHCVQCSKQCHLKGVVCRCHLYTAAWLLQRDTHTFLEPVAGRRVCSCTTFATSKLLLRLQPEGSSLCLLQEGVTGDVSGGGNPVLNPEQEAKVSLLRSGPAPNIQSNTSFYLTAVYTGSAGVALAGITISGGLPARSGFVP